MHDPNETEVEYENSEPLMGLAQWIFSDEDDGEDYEYEGLIYDEY